LQILLAHERITLGPRNLIAILRDEILATIAKHVEIGPEALTVKMGQAGSVSTLEIDVEIPTEKVGAKPAHQEATLAKAAAASR
jgi:cell division topological specificity factor